VVVPRSLCPAINSLVGEQLYLDQWLELVRAALVPEENKLLQALLGLAIEAEGQE